MSLHPAGFWFPALSRRKFTISTFSWTQFYPVAVACLGCVPFVLLICCLHCCLMQPLPYNHALSSHLSLLLSTNFDSFVFVAVYQLWFLLVFCDLKSLASFVLMWWVLMGLHNNCKHINMSFEFLFIHQWWFRLFSKYILTVDCWFFVNIIHDYCATSNGSQSFRRNVLT